MTKSEKLFEQYCKDNGITCNRIKEGTTKTPDYFISIDGVNIVAEIKQIDLSKKDQELVKEFEENKLIADGGTPGDKVRDKIKSAVSQISKLSKGKYPSILVLYNNLPFVLHNPIESYDIRVGMYGLESIVLTNPVDIKTPIKVIDRKFGPKRKMTREHNTSISALVVLNDTEENGLWLAVYHNCYAVVELPKNIFKSKNTKEFILSAKQVGAFQEWESIR